jgi:hypothetical protein
MPIIKMTINTTERRQRIPSIPDVIVNERSKRDVTADVSVADQLREAGSTHLGGTCQTRGQSISLAARRSHSIEKIHLIVTSPAYRGGAAQNFGQAGAMHDQHGAGG